MVKPFQVSVLCSFERKMSDSNSRATSSKIHNNGKAAVVLW